jgi:hypothetical protein
MRQQTVESEVQPSHRLASVNRKPLHWKLTGIYIGKCAFSDILRRVNACMIAKSRFQPPLFWKRGLA